jgi:hypothetical protein
LNIRYFIPAIDGGRKFVNYSHSIENLCLYPFIELAC